METVEDVVADSRAIDRYVVGRLHADETPDYAPFAYLSIDSGGAFHVIGIGVTETNPWKGRIFDGQLDRTKIQETYLSDWKDAVTDTIQTYAEQGEIDQTWMSVVRSGDAPRRYSTGRDQPGFYRPDNPTALDIYDTGRQDPADEPAQDTVQVDINDDT